MVEVGQKAPDFAAPAVESGGGTLVELFADIEAHEAVVLVFQPAAFVPTGTAEFRALADAGWAAHEDLRVIGLTGDSLYSNAASADQYDLPFTFVSDFHGGIADSYDLLLAEWEGHTQIPGRASVVIGGDWEVLAVFEVAPLDQSERAPVALAGEVLRDRGIDVATPRVRYTFQE